MVLFAEFGTSHLFLLGLLLTSAAILFQAQRRMKLSMNPVASHGRRQRAADEPVRRHRPALATESRLRTAQQLEASAELDARLAELDRLIRTARHESQRLESAIAQALSLERPGESYVPPSQAQALQATVRSIERSLPAPPLQGGLATQRPFAKICALAEAGLEAPQIAEQVGTPVGEVELILGLRTSTDRA